VRLYDIDIDRLRGTGLPIITQAQGEEGELIPKLGTRLDALGRRACVAFAGNLGQACVCTIYSDRPEACRQFEVGGALCIEARRRVGIEDCGR
jgi:Fe-S-cluster containining protein